MCKLYWNWYDLFSPCGKRVIFVFGVRIFVLILACPGQKFKYDNGAVWGLSQNKRNLINKRKKPGGRGPAIPQTFFGLVSDLNWYSDWDSEADSGFSAAGWPGCRGHYAQSRFVWDSRDGTERNGTISMRISIGPVSVCVCVCVSESGPHMQSMWRSCSFFAPLSVCECGFLGP